MKHIVGFSGGIDSQATALWVRNRYSAEDVILLNSDAGGNESPMTTAWIRDYSARVFPVITITPIVADMWLTEGYAEKRGFDGNETLTFARMLGIKKMPPARTRQYCSAALKIFPQRRWTRRNFGAGGIYEGEDYCRYTGVRRDESARREAWPFEQWDDFNDCAMFAPLADWTKQMCFDFVRAHGEEPNPLYKLGFGRVGCAPCINSSKADIRAWAERDPSMIDKVRAYEKESGVTFFMPVRRDGISNTIDEVVDWAYTDVRRGELMVFPERPSCESKYGLCA